MSRNSASLDDKLKKNIIKYSWFKIFTKRVYLPLIVIQLVNVGQVTVNEIALIAVITAIVAGLLQMPGGYLADKLGNRFAILLGCSLGLFSPLFYVFAPNFYGGLAASVLFFGSWSFVSGAIEAFMHDTLVALRREKDYTKVMGRAQSYGLIGNVILIAAVPATYAVDQNLPFLIGFLAQIVMLLLAISFTFPKHETSAQPKSPIKAARSIVTLENIMLFVFAGFLSGVANRGGEYRELLWQDMGVVVAIFGVLLAASSVAGAIMGMFIHVFDQLRPLVFYMFDLLFMSICFITIGLTDNAVVAVVSFILFAGYGRVRLIVFQSKLLTDVAHTYKATLLSALNLFTVIGEVAAISLLATLIGIDGYIYGYLLFGVSVFGIGLVLWYFMLAERRKRTLKQAHV